jgi:phosphoenolpyruvate carboxykinase (ATP)
LNTPQLYEEAVQRHEGYVAHLGPLVVRTGNQSSLAHSDRFIVDEPATRGNVSWGEVNLAYDENHFDHLLDRMTAYFNGLDIFVQDAYVRTATVDEKMAIRVVTETAWHNLFVRNSYLNPDADDIDSFVPEFTVLHAPGFRAVPERDGTNTDVFVIIHLTRKLILIGGTSFAGEIQKAIFSVLNYLLPREAHRDVLPLEGAANMNDAGEAALFIGTDGSGKTSLASDETRLLVGDAEHGWDDDGIFSIGRGCYPQALGLNMKQNYAIWQTTRRFGTILENVMLDVQTRRLDLDDDSFTENTRLSYPITHLVRATRKGTGSHPRNILLLVKDGFGVLPLVSKLSPEQAHYFFLSGYTTEEFVDDYGKPITRAKFSACYGAPFMPLHPGHYAKMFADKVAQHNANVWLVNTGWIGGPFGTGKRILLDTSRNAVRAILNGDLLGVSFRMDRYLNLMIPELCPGVPPSVLDPSKTWDDEAAYMAAARNLMDQFDANYAQYDNEVNPAMLAQQPRFS